jgi:small-conductance mechanosensitive channel
MLIFKDSILGFVAGIQLSAYDMVREGDWITVPSRGIDGDVLDINLSTVKVQNFDKTIATIPTYALVQESFINWKGMQQAGGRRIKRAIYIDMNSIKIVTPQMLEKYRQIPLIKDYIEQKIQDLKYQPDQDELSVLNGKSLTNVGVFRVYVENYLKANVRIYKKYKKEKFNYQGHEVERFVIDDKKEFLESLDKDAEKFLLEIEGKTVIRDVNKFLVRYSDNYMLENNYLYKIRKVKKLVIRKGTEVEIEIPEKILIQPGLFCDDLTMLVRELKPSEKGLPVEVYVFAATTDWAEYEKIQADLFEHLLAVLPIFELRVFQELSGNDIVRVSTGH